MFVWHSTTSVCESGDGGIHRKGTPGFLKCQKMRLGLCFSTIEKSLNLTEEKENR